MHDRIDARTDVCTTAVEDEDDFDARLARLEQQVDDLTTLLLNAAVFNTQSLIPIGDRAATAKQLFDAKGSYPKGCSQFVCAVLGIPYEMAKTLMGTNPEEIHDWSAVPVGAIIGWQKPNGPYDHVSVYVADAESKFTDVRQPADSQVSNPKPRRLSNYGPQTLYLSSRFGN